MKTTINPRTFLSFVSLIICTIMFAQVPQAVNYQAVLRDGSNDPMKNKSISLLINIIDSSNAGDTVYTETHSVTTDDLGQVNLHIGKGTTLHGTFSNIIWEKELFYMDLAIDTSNSDTYEHLGLSQLVSVPYSLYAEYDGDWNVKETSNDPSGDIYTYKKVSIGSYSNASDDGLLLKVTGDGGYEGNHIALFKSSGCSPGGDDGIAIQINCSQSNGGYQDGSTNFLTFFDFWGNVAGRIEGIQSNELPSATNFNFCTWSNLGINITSPTSVATVYTCYSGGGVVYASGHGDYAEWLERIDHEEELFTSDIVGVIGGKITRSTKDAEQIMVISMNPIVLGNEPDDEERATYEKVGFMGQVMTKVHGPVSSGDYIIPSGDNDGYGLAVKAKDLTLDQMKQIAGRSWSTSDKEGTNIISMVIGVQSNEWVDLMKHQQETINRIKTDIDGIKADMNPKVNELEKRIEELERIILNKAEN